MTNDEKLELINHLYYFAYKSTESFEYFNFGSNLMYLVGAICTDKKVELNRTEFNQQKMYRFLCKTFANNHSIWQFVETD